MIAAFIFGMGVAALLEVVYELILRLQKLPTQTHASKTIECLLSILFPPRLPGCVVGWGDRVEYQFDVQGSAGNVKKRYRDGIDRYFSENP
jgi:hypothetical protein